MIEAGIVLLAVGALIAFFASGDLERVGIAAAVIGLVLVILGALLGGEDGLEEAGLFGVLGLASARGRLPKRAPNRKPVPKVKAGGTAGGLAAVAAVLIQLVVEGTVTDDGKLLVGGLVLGAIAAFIGGYLKHDEVG